MNSYGRFAAVPPAIPTKAELLQLRKEQQAAHTAPAYTPRGVEAGLIQDSAKIARDQRATYVQARLERVSAVTQPEHRLSAMKGRTRQEFDRSR